MAEEDRIEKEEEIAEEKEVEEKKEERWHSKVSEKPVSLFIFIILIVLVLADLYIKLSFGYNPQIEFLISFIMGGVFLYLVWGHRTLVGLTIITFIFDVVMIQIPLRFVPSVLSEAVGWLMALKSLFWLILMIILFVMIVISYTKEGGKAPWIIKWVGYPIVAVIVIASLFAALGLISSSGDYTNSYKTYHGLTREKVEIVETAAREAVKEIVVPAIYDIYWGTLCGLKEPLERSRCIEEKRNDYKCKKWQEREFDSKKDCIEWENGLKTGSVGVIDPKQKEPLRLTWEPGKEFSQKQIYLAGQTIEFSAKLKIENPRESRLNLELGCFLKNNEGREIIGQLTILKGASGGINTLATEKSEEVDVFCRPLEDLEKEKTYKVIYWTKLLDFTTKTKLLMLFLGDKTEEEIREKLNDYNDKIPGQARAPNDPAWINFNFGGEGYVTNIPTKILEVSVENKGGGEILDIKKIEINLEAAGIESGDISTFSQCSLTQTGNKLSINPGIILAQKKESSVYGGFCALLFGERLTAPDKLVKPVEFEGELIYSYQIEKEFNTPVMKELPGAISTPVG